MDDEANEYVLELEKLMSSEIAATFWAPTMDILVIITFDNLLEGYRISFKAQRFFQIEEPQSIQALCFSPDSQLITYSLLDGTVKIIRTQNGERVLTLQNFGFGQIFDLNYKPFACVNPEEFMPFVKNSIESRLILNISPHKNCNKNAIIKINYFNELKPDFTCLILSEKHKIRLLLNGFVPIAQVDLTTVLPPSSNQFRILHSHLDQKLYAIVAEEVESTYNLSVVVFETESILQAKQDIVKFNCLICNISEIFNFIDTTFTALEACIRDIIRQYNSKINLIDDSSTPDIVPREELLQYLSIGLTSSTLMNFFTKEIFDTKVLQKMDETLTALFTNLHDIIIESVQNGLERATLFLNKLISYSQVEKYASFGIKTQELREIQQKIIRIYTLGEALLVESTETKFNIRNLLIWLNKASIKTAQENEAEIENSKSFLNKYTVDYNRLYKFLSDEDTFRLQNLLKFFRKADDREPLRMPDPDFQMLKGVEQRNIFKKNNPTQQQISLYKTLEQQLGLESIEVHARQEMDVQNLYSSFKVEMKSLLAEWKKLLERPSQLLGSKITKLQHRHSIGKVTITELFPFEPKFLQNPRDQHLYMYYIDREEEYDRIVRYNCSLQTRSYVYTAKYTILSITVAEEIIGVFEEKMGERKLVAQVANEQFDGSEIEFGNRMSNCDQTELAVNSGMKGLNSLVVDKTKLVIFDAQ